MIGVFSHSASHQLLSRDHSAWFSFAGFSLSPTRRRCSRENGFCMPFLYSPWRVSVGRQGQPDKRASSRLAVLVHVNREESARSRSRQEKSASWSSLQLRKVARCRDAVGCYTFRDMASLTKSKKSIEATPSRSAKNVIEF